MVLFLPFDWAARSPSPSAISSGASELLNLKTIEFPVERTPDHANRSEVTGQFARLVWAEYAEMRGLSVTLAQAQRLWGVDERTCRGAFDALIARGILRRTTKGRYVRVST